jgi:hypothetical protein
MICQRVSLVLIVLVLIVLERVLLGLTARSGSRS